MVLLNNFFKYILILTLVVSSFIVSASETDGTISNTYFNALLCRNDNCSITTKINFKTTLGNAIHITDTAITGDAWSETMGWIRFNPGGGFGGVINNSSGVVSGYAWGDVAGWINFKPTQGGVTINSTGQFAGWAWSENYGWIRFDCNVANACVQTDWRPLSARTSSPSPTPTPIHTGTGTVTKPPAPPVAPPVVPPVTPPIVYPEPPVEPVPPPTPEPVIQPKEPTTEPTLPPPAVEPTSPPTIAPKIPIPTYSAPGASTTTRFAVTQVTAEQIFTDVKESFKNTVEVGKKAEKEIKRIIETPEGNATSKVITTTGAISGVAVSATTVLFANPLSFGELFLIPFRLWSLLLAALGIKKRNRPWGTVYDSITKQPLDPAYVILQDLNGNEVASSITDLDGRYGFLVPAGQYRMIAKKTNYSFPSTGLAGKSKDELYSELYFNEVINVEEGGVISRNIPMDPLKFDWNEFAKRDKNIMRFFNKRDLWIARVSNILFILGFIITVIAVIASPVFYNILILVVYLILLVLKRTVLKPRAYGYINSKETNNPLSFAIMRVFYAGSDNEVIHKVTDKTGKYYCLVPNGKYYTKIESKNNDQSYTLVHTSEPIEVKNGYIGEKFEI